MSMKRILALGLVAALAAPAARAADWPQFRGPNGSGISTETELPQEWAADKNVQWKVKSPGKGWSSPVVVGDKVFLTAAWSEKEPAARPGGGGRPGGGFPPGGGRPPGGGGGMGGRGGAGAFFAVKAGASGDITPKDSAMSSDGVAWMTKKAGPGMSSPLVYDGYIYLLQQNGGMVTCLEAKAGKIVYDKERIPQARAFWASPWAHDGKIFCLDDGGTTHVLKAGPEFKVLSKNALGGDQFWATPALAGGNVILRGVESIYCIKR